MPEPSAPNLLSKSGIFAKVTGEGEPLVLLHGLFGSFENVGGIARLLANRYRVISLDLPNHGRSKHIEESSLLSFADRIDQALDELDIQSCFMVGHSLGGKVAMEIALRSPERVLKLGVLDIAPVNYPPRHDDVFSGLLSIDLGSIQSRSDADKQLQVHVNEIAVRSFLLKNVHKTVDGYSWRMNLSSIHRGYQKLIEANSQGVFEKPTLFLKGEKSDYITEEYRDEILSRFPKPELKVVSDTDHWLHAEKPDMVANLILRFLGK